MKMMRRQQVALAATVAQRSQANAGWTRAMSSRLRWAKKAVTVIDRPNRTSMV
jgi:hypothetical protein